MSLFFIEPYHYARGAEKGRKEGRGGRGYRSERFSGRGALREILDGGRKGSGKIIKSRCIYPNVECEAGNMLRQQIGLCNGIVYFLEIGDLTPNPLSSWKGAPVGTNAERL